MSIKNQQLSHQKKAKTEKEKPATAEGGEPSVEAKDGDAKADPKIKNLTGPQLEGLKKLQTKNAEITRDARALLARLDPAEVTENVPPFMVTKFNEGFSSFQQSAAATDLAITMGKCNLKALRAETAEVMKLFKPLSSQLETAVEAAEEHLGIEAPPADAIIAGA